MTGKRKVTSSRLATVSCKKKKREENTMKLNFVIPDMEKTFGKLTFAGAGDETAQRVSGSGNRRVVTRTFNLYSDVQRADDIEVTIPGKAGVKLFDVDSEVKLVNPRITATGYAISNRGYTLYHLLADDIIPADNAMAEK